VVRVALFVWGAWTVLGDRVGSLSSSCSALRGRRDGAARVGKLTQGRRKHVDGSWLDAPARHDHLDYGAFYFFVQYIRYALGAGPVLPRLNFTVSKARAATCHSPLTRAGRWRHRRRWISDRLFGGRRGRAALIMTARWSRDEPMPLMMPAAAMARRREPTSMHSAGNGESGAKDER